MSAIVTQCAPPHLGGDRLTQLHLRLQEEAEKIRKWKTSTEMNFKQKESQLKEAFQTIDSQKKNLLDLQVGHS